MTTADPHSELSASGELLSLMEEWHRLTQREGEAIEREDWPAVAEHQGRKQLLSEAMTRVRERLHPGLSSHPLRGSSEEQRFRAVLAEVVALEHRNSEVISAKRQRQQKELERLNQATRHLHGARQAYGPSSQPCWQSYS